MRELEARENDAGQVATEASVGLRLTWPWWLHPALLAFAIPTGLTLYCLSLPSSAFADWGVPKVLSGNSAVLLIVGACAFALAIAVASWRPTSSRSATITLSPRQVEYLGRATRTLFILTVAGYVIWATSAALRGATLSQLLAILQFEPGAVSALKKNATPIGGITTITQFGPVVAALCMIRMRLVPDARSEKTYLYIVLALAALRSFLYAERLALIEVLGPVVVVAAVCRPKGGRRPVWIEGAIKLAPLLALPALWTFFAIFEYSRSWLTVGATSGDSFFQYVTSRVSGYYITAVNNSALFVDASDVYGYPTSYSLKFLWSFPATAQFMEFIVGDKGAPWWQDFLKNQANPEYNSPGSFLVTYAELGLVGMLVFWILLGLAIGRAYRAMRLGSLVGLLVTSVCLVPVLELPRIIYWAEGRSTPVWLACLVLAHGLRLRRPVQPARKLLQPEVRRTR
ncbi:O-antigen polymerase [Blastococcus sp. CT_GayMR16]|uniref:O-antigen polymerase n=1 Tax=Blastococcus sp. CT_GayMR16 TaxID=2559607 RepID=UPI00143113A5|nr:O-antigen polymerase [Blastococcus sp. CT_GayMR16]